MATQKPLVFINGRTQQIPIGDTLPLAMIPNTPLSDPATTELVGEWPGDVIQFDGTKWRNQPLAVGSPGSSAVQTLYNASPTITAVSANNSLAIRTLNLAPVITGELTGSATANDNGIPISAWIVGTAIKETTIPAGIWTTVIYAGVDSVAGGRLTWINRRVFEVLIEAMTITTTGTGTSRTATAASGSPFISGDANASGEIANWIQTPQGIYQITGYTSATVVTIATPSGYANESGVSFKKWKGLFVTSSTAVTSISPTYMQQTWDSLQGAFTVLATSFLGMMDFAVNAAGSTTLTMTYNGDTGATKHSRTHTPLASGFETNSSVGVLIDAATAKSTPVDADMIGLVDSAASNILKKVTWANIKATLFNSPTLITPALGTPASGVLTNCTGVINTGIHSIWIPAVAMIQRNTNGSNPGSVETTTNKVMIKTQDFDPATVQYAQFSVKMPKSWDLGTVTAVFAWSHAATTTNFGLVWGLQGLALSSTDLVDTAFGTAQETTSTGGTTDKMYFSSVTSAITIGNTSAAEDMVIFQVYRLATSGSDTLAINARLHGVLIKYTINAGTDS